MKPLKIAALLATLTLCIAVPACSRTDQRKVPGPAEKITFSYANLPDCALIHIAREKGYFLQQGLDVTPRTHTFGKLALQDVLEGKADFAAVAETPFMFAVMNGQKIAIIATIQSSKTEHAIVARRDRGIITKDDLKGKRIAAAAGTTSEFFMDVFLTSNNIAREEITFVNMKMEELPAALSLGAVDAVSIFNPYRITARNKLGSNGVTFLDENIFTSTFNIAAQQEFIRNNPEKARKVIQALFKAEQFIRNHPAEAQKIVAASIGVDLAVVQEIWKDNIFGLMLDQQLILALEDESRWAVKRALTAGRKIPNYLEFIYPDPLQSISPASVWILR